MTALSELPVADVWWVRERVDDDITLVVEPHVHPFLRCNVWHVRGRDADLVIDTGMGIRPLRPFVERELDGPLIAIATHAHSDHVGGLHEFEHRAIHAAEADAVAEPQLAAVDTSVYGESTVGVYEAAGYEFGAHLIDAVPPGGVEPFYEIAPAPATRVLTDADVVDLGDRRFEVLHLPGHSPGSIGLWEEATGVLFSGDALYDGPLLDALEGSDPDAYLTTMRRLRTLPVTVVHGGHERSFGRDRLIELCDGYLTARGTG
ncbi:MAG: MBL fold metallo-hydrolase [Actinomycetota bacterium]